MAIKVSRIEKEYILKTLTDGEWHFEVAIDRKAHPARIISFQPKEILLELKEAISAEPVDRQIDLFIQFRGTRVTGRAQWLRCDGLRLSVSNPPELFRDLNRGYERVRLQEKIFISFMHEGKRLDIDVPRSMEYYEPAPPAHNVAFDATKITSLLKAFRDKAMSFASENKIVMFRDRKPTELAELLIAWSGRTLILPFDANREQKAREGGADAFKILTQEDVSRIIKSSGKDPSILAQAFGRHLESLRRKRIWHEVYCPVLYQAYVVGYIYLMRSEQHSNPFTNATLDFVHQFSKLLSYSLSQNGFFQLKEVRESFDRSELVDISGSGLLFAMPLNGPALELYKDCELTLKILDRSMLVRGRIMRRYQDDQKVYIGVKFMEISDDDLGFLFEQLYGGAKNLGFADDAIIENSGSAN